MERVQIIVQYSSLSTYLESRRSEQNAWMISGTKEIHAINVVQSISEHLELCQSIHSHNSNRKSWKSITLKVWCYSKKKIFNDWYVISIQQLYILIRSITRQITTTTMNILNDKNRRNTIRINRTFFCSVWCKRHQLICVDNFIQSWQ